MNRFSKDPQYHQFHSIYSPFPIDEMIKLGAIQEDRTNKALAQEDELTGLRASILNAPGHKDYAQKVLKPFDDKITQISQMDPRDPNLVREIRKTKQELITNPDVKNIITSKENYDKRWSSIMNEPKNRQAIYDMPGVINDKGQFIENSVPYDNLNYIPPTPYIDRINEYLSKIPITKTANKGQGYVTVDKQGNKLFVQPNGYTEKRGPQEFSTHVPGLTASLTNPSDPDYQYMKADFERTHGQGSFTPKNVNDYIMSFTPLHEVNNDMRDSGSQFIREPAGSTKTPNPISTPDFVYNQNAQNIPAKEQTNAFNPRNNDISIPYLGTSNVRVNQPIGVDGRYVIGQRKSYIVGDENSGTFSDSGGNYGAPINSQKPLYNARVTGHVVGYKILQAPQGSDAANNVGNLVTVGPNYGSVGSTDLQRTPIQDKTTGQYYIINSDKEKIIVQPVALRILQGSESEGSDAKDSENLFFEEMPRQESMKYFGGKNFSNEKLLDITSDGQLEENIDSQKGERLLAPFVTNPAAVELMQKYNDVKVKLTSKNYKLTPEDQQVINSMNQLLEDAEYQQDVIPSIISPKNEYTPSGVLGTETNK